MQKEIFKIPYLCTIVESANWTPLIKNEPVLNLSISYSIVDNSTNLYPNMASYVKEKLTDTKIEFYVECDKSPEITKIISNIGKLQYTNICIIFDSDDLKYLVHDAFFTSFESNSLFDDTTYFCVKAICKEIELL